MLISYGTLRTIESGVLFLTPSVLWVFWKSTIDAVRPAYDTLYPVPRAYRGSGTTLPVL